MNEFIDALLEKDTFTENGAVTNSTSHDYCVDLFFLAGACRNERTENIETAILKSYNQDRLTTLKVIFWAGDIREGAGERRFFKIALDWLNKNHPEDLQNNLSLVPEFSRWDVLFELANKNPLVFSYITSVLVQKEHPQYGLLCKWLPRKSKVVDKKKRTVRSGKTTNEIVSRTERTLYDGLALKIQKALRLTPKQYRKMLVEGTKVVETKMCNKEWDKIDYSKVPSVAMNKYNKAWYVHDSIRFSNYIADVKAGKAKINASVIFPHDILKSAFSSYYTTELNEAQITQWENLPNYLTGVNDFIPICDVSGSMYGTPLLISLALGLYLSERNVGLFKDAFITFSETPHMQYLTGNINEKLEQLSEADWGMNTNLLAVFRLILNKAKDNNLSADLMPKRLLVISDMEFDDATDQANNSTTNYDAIRCEYIQAGYKMPQIVFWNVNGRAGNLPVTKNTIGAALISGASPRIIKSVLTGNLDPVKVMNDTLNSERYSQVK